MVQERLTSGRTDLSNSHCISVKVSCPSPLSMPRSQPVLLNYLTSSHIQCIAKPVYFSFVTSLILCLLLSSDPATTLEHISLSTSYLDYCKSPLASLPASSLSPFQSILHSAIKVIFSKGQVRPCHSPT